MGMAVPNECGLGSVGTGQNSVSRVEKAISEKVIRTKVIQKDIDHMFHAVKTLKFHQIRLKKHIFALEYIQACQFQH